MRNIWYLAIVIGVSIVGVLVVWARSRPTSSPRSSIERFNDKMDALSPERALRVDRAPAGGLPASAVVASGVPTARSQVDPRRSDDDATETS